MIDALVEVVGPWWLVLAIATAILGSGRWTRLLVFDEYPPTMWIREKWAKLTVKHPAWTKLFFCWWCAAPWIMLICIGWFWLSFSAFWVALTWWLFFGWGALSYVTSMVVARDDPRD